jgi:hypothetical protein
MPNQDWVVYGQTAMPAAPNGGVTNPTPGTGLGQGLNINGLVGEVTSLPYTVPEGKQLVLEGWGFEGLNQPFGVCIPFIGDAPVTNAKCLPSVGCGGSQASYYITGTRFTVPAGKKVGVFLLNGTTIHNVICAWFVQGHLEDVV